MTPPRLAAYHLRDYCAAAAVHILRGREASYPALVEGGKMAAADAEASLTMAQALAGQWQWAMNAAGSIDPPWDEPRGINGFGAYNHELIDELTGVASRARAMATRTGSWEAREMADLCDALLWWQQSDPRRYTARIVQDVSCERRCAVRLAERARTAA